ncbi:hypothetical protein [Herbiconiux daphne]|uniref:Uncharacterized protein n=1 Tax=Herbiconiux daphne TaxID=2970914 RepID=A0ABT2GYS3_9MICO|nr:hypothetical protein [Herbiconiux daphne]MCS5733100.1 hypothetical protein [Herbiconiux daphne]
MSESELSGPEFTGETALQAAPWETKLSFWLWLAEAVLGIVNGILIIAGAVLVTAVVGLENDGAVATVGVLVALGILIAALAVFRIVCSVFMLRGKVWARNALTILGVLGLIGVIWEFQSNPGVAIAHALVLLVALIAMFLPNSNAYFRAPYPEK